MRHIGRPGRFLSRCTQIGFGSKQILPSSAAIARSISSGARKDDNVLNPLDTFPRRHNLQPENPQVREILQKIGSYESLESLVKDIIPSDIYVGSKDLDFSFEKDGRRAVGEREALEELRRDYASKNKVLKSLIGMGYYGTITPPVILRNIVENPGWYTQYTPYQAEISQGRLESLLNYQTMVSDLTGLSVSNASLLDEGTAAAEAMNVCFNNSRKGGQDATYKFLVDHGVSPQTLDVVRTRAIPLNIEVVVGDFRTFDAKSNKVCGALIQYPNVDGRVLDYDDFCAKIHENDGLVVCTSDLLALTVLRPPGEFGADICIGNSQRFGVPLGYGGPHAAFMAVREEFKRIIPGRLIGVSKDSQGNMAYRMALQTREQHIRRDKATSNICTAQALLANCAAMYAVYHGPEGLRKIATTVHKRTLLLRNILEQQLGYQIANSKDSFFDTFVIQLSSADQARKLSAKAVESGFNLRLINDTSLGVSLDETIGAQELDILVHKVFAAHAGKKLAPDALDRAAESVTSSSFDGTKFARQSEYLSHPVFNIYHTEHELLRYIYRLQARDISLAQSMIPLGSCTMKLNATSEMIPITWPEFNSIHPFAPLEQSAGYLQLFQDLEKWLGEITGFDAVSLQPNAGSQGEFTGLLAIKKYLESLGQHNRNICLIPVSAHGTNPASAVMAGMRVVVVKCDSNGNIDMADLKKKAQEYSKTLACVMVTYPSTHGVYEEGIAELCRIVHEHGGQVYMDGANMNAQVALTSPGRIGADVCHLNLHKTFCIPHGGGGPGMGPIGVKSHLAPFLPNHAVVDMPGTDQKTSMGAVSAAPWSSASILPISWMYIRMMGSKGLKNATQVAIMNANYMVSRLDSHYKVVYKGKKGLVAHEFILDINKFLKTANVGAEDVAKRLMDYGFHAPTMSFPIAGTLMIEPTESESKEELDRFCDALISIREEIRQIEEGKFDREDNPLKNAPHTLQMVTMDKWNHKYTREVAAFPNRLTKEVFKFWPTVARIDSAFGDKNLICTCPPLDSYSSEPVLVAKGDGEDQNRVGKAKENSY
jgi:glycine dehydrogenase